jgi:hypothetical protein
MSKTSTAHPRPRDLSFDRTISEELLSFFRSDAGQRLRAVRDREPLLFDIQLRSDRPKGNRSWATLYYGLTSLLDVEENGKGYLRLRAHTTHQKAGGFDPPWAEWMPPHDLANVWHEVEAYLTRARPKVQKRWIEKEGGVHAALASGNSDAFRIINREASPSFLDSATKKEIGEKVWQPIGTALRGGDVTEKWWPNQMTVGNSLDFLAVDVGGRLALIEAKHHSATGMIAKVAAQVGSYARLYSYLLQDDQQGALTTIDEMLKQRVQLRLARNGVLYLTQPVRIAPIVAIGPGRPSRAARDRLWQVAQVLDRVPPLRHPRASGPPVTVEPLEVWYVDGAGRITDIERAGDIDPAQEIGAPRRGIQ